MENDRDIIENWRIDWNEGRPYNSLKGMKPGEYNENTGKIIIAVGLEYGGRSWEGGHILN